MQAAIHTADSRCATLTKLTRSTTLGNRSHAPRMPSLTSISWTPSHSRQVPCAAAAASGSEKGASASIYTVGDVMTTGRIVSCAPDTTVDEALEMLVEFRITGLPVVDEENNVVGVVSDYDLLALDTLGRVNDDTNLFPVADQTWQAFKEVKSLLAKTGGKRVKDVMTKKPIMVREKTDIEDAARILLSKKIRRLPVVDENGKLCGIISRSNLVKAALSYRKSASQQS